jgi:hypothetical protein
MTAQTDTGGRVRMSGWVTVLVDLTNQGAELSAELVVEPAGREYRPQYVVPLTLPAGARKRVPVDLPAGQMSDIAVTLRSGGQMVATQTINVSTLPPGANFIAVLSDDELGVPGLSQLAGKGESLVQVARLDAAGFPHKGALLDNYNVVALSRFDTGKLSPEQLRALEAWVGRGGTLLLSGGPEWKRTLAPLPASLVPVEVTGVAEASLQAVADLGGKPIAANAPVSTGMVRRGQVLATAGSFPLVVVDRVGAGRVIYQAFDPALEPMVAWPGQATYLERLLGQAVAEEVFDRGNPMDMMGGALQRLPGLALPSPLVLGSLLGGYLLLVGPVTYWILKRRDRREWAWFTVPALSLLFVGGIYAAGYSKQVSVISHLITVTRLAPGAQAASLESYVGVYAPSRTEMAVAVGGNRLVRALEMGRGGMEQGVSARVVAGDQTRLELLGMNNYSMRGFLVQQDATVNGGVALTDVAFTAAGSLTARVVNRLGQDLQNVAVTAGGDWARIGTVAAGQTSDPFTLDLATGGLQGFKNGIPFFPADGGSGMTMVDDRRQQVLSAIFGWDGSGLPAGSLAVVGWTGEPLVAPDLPELGRQTSGTNLVYLQMPIPVDAERGDVPPGVIVGGRTGGAGFGRSPYGYSLSQGTHAFRFVLPPLDPARVAELNLHLPVMANGGTYTLRLRDPKTGQMETLNARSVQSIANWQRFVGPGSVVELEIDVADHLEIAAPSISVKGVGR